MDSRALNLAGGLVVATLTLVGCGNTDAGSSAVSGDTVFAEGFETGSLAAWTDGVDPARHRIVEDSIGAHSGHHYLEVTYPASADGGWLTHFFLPGYDSLYVSVWVRFPDSWKSDSKLLALYGSRTDNQWSAFGQAGKCPVGNDFFAAMVVSEPSATTGAGPLRFYTYYPAMAREPDGVTCYGRFGDGSETYSAAALSPNAWHHIEFCVRLNAPGKADAGQALLVDGVRRGAWSGFSFRDSPILRLNAVQLTFSRGLGGTPPAQQLLVDDVTIRSTQPNPCQVPGF